MQLSPITSAEEQKRRQVRDYFDRKPDKLAIFLSSAAVLCIVLALSSSSLLLGLTGLILVGGALVLRRRRQALLSDQAVDQCIKEDFDARDFAARAKGLLGMPETTRQPVVLQGPAPDQRASGITTGQRVGDDAYLRYTPQLVTVLLSTDDQLGIYQGCLDHTTGNIANETFLELFYQDLTAITVSAMTQSLDLNVANAGLRSMKLSSGQKKIGLSRKKLDNNLNRLRTHFRADIVADLLQRDMTTIYRIDVSDGQHVEMPLVNGRATRQANLELDDYGAGASAGMTSLREYVRDKKRASLHPEPGMV